MFTLIFHFLSGICDSVLAQEAYTGGYWDQMAAFIRSLFNATFKTNPSLDRAILIRETHL